MTPAPSESDPTAHLPTETAAPGSPGSGRAPSTGAPMNQWIGRHVGPYRIQKILGRGGMGAVFLAIRDDDQFRKSVALKLLRFDADDPALLARFRNERQILATLDHPNIAALYDGGSTEEGLPYLVMEYVAGETLTAYCQSRNLSIPERLQIFCRICDAVQYAHQKLIVHRDLKPGNILVTREGVPKLLDFGIAKLLCAPELLGDSAPRTQTGYSSMTPDYASPEQIRGEPVSTASDVYSLGAVLYEVLTAQRPHRLTRYDLQELHSQICESDPRAPSTVGGQALKGDLDTIVLKAMHRDPARRYRSAEQFSEDLQRHLQHRPVLARPDTVGYRLSRFAARNRWGIAAAAAVALSLVGGAVVALSQASMARQRFQQVRKLAGRFIELHDDVARLPGSVKVREKMVATALDYLDNLSRGAGKDPELLHEIGDAYEKVANAQGSPGQPNLGRTGDALASFRKAVDFDRRAAALNPAYRARLADTESAYAYLAMVSGHVSDARPSLQDAAAILGQLRKEKPEDPDVLRLAASVALHQGDLDEYEGHASDRLAAWQQARQFTAEYARIKQDNASRARLHLITGLVAEVLAENQRFDEALAVLHEGEPLIDSLLTLEPDNPLYLRQKMSEANYLGQIYYHESGNSLNKPAEAVAADRRYVALAQRLSDADPANASARLSLAIACFQLCLPLGKIDPAAGLASVRKSLQIFDADLVLRPNDRLLRSRRARALRYLSYALQANRRPEEARQAASEALAIQRQLLAESPSDISEREQIAVTEKALSALGPTSARP